MLRNARRSARTGVQKRRFGPLQREVSIIGQGTWHIEEGDPASAIAALRRGIDLGMNHIDTAEMYGAGAAEKLVGDAIGGRRDEVFLVSKVLPQNASRLGTKIACERSLTRLKTNWLDCYLLHWRGPHPLEDTFAAFDALREEGKILSYGVSNFDVPDLEEALPANRALSAIKCSIICRNARSNMPCYPGASSTVSPSPRIVHSGTAIFRASTRRAAACLRISRRRMMRPRARSRLHF
jgi:diketogulonate reductase-like aldo/keto reductase